MSLSKAAEESRKSEYYAEGYWRHEDLWTTIAGRAARAPAKAALICDDRSITFGELLTEAERIARGLRGRGLRAGDVVVIHGRNSVETVTAMLACTWLGAVIAGVPPMFSESQVQSVADNAEARAVICTGDPKEIARAVSGAKASASVSLIVVADGTDNDDGVISWAALYDNANEAARVPVDADSLTLLAYSSGTTGAPKGVMHTANTVRYAIEQRAAVQSVDDRDICLVVSQFGFVGNVVFGLLTGLVLGATSVVMRHWSPERALELIESRGVTYGLFMPTHVFDLLDCPALDNTDLSAFQRAAMGGLSTERRIEVQRRLCAKPLPGYGMSECMGNATCRVTDPDEKILKREGRPYPGTVIRIVDEDDRELAPGDVGKVQVTGPSRCFGYYHAAEQTVALFTSDGFVRTGDLGYLDGDGYLSFVGREKDIIRRGGVTIVPGEVESALMEHPRIERVAVVALPDERLGERACACVITSDGKAMTLDEITTFLDSRSVARYQWPERVEVFDEFPLTASLKTRKPDLVKMLLASHSRHNEPTSQ